MEWRLFHTYSTGVIIMPLLWIFIYFQYSPLSLVKTYDVDNKKVKLHTVVLAKDDILKNIDNLKTIGIHVNTHLYKQFWSTDEKILAHSDKKTADYLKKFKNECETVDSLEKVRQRRSAQHTNWTWPLCPCVPGTLGKVSNPNSKYILTLNDHRHTKYMSKNQLRRHGVTRTCLVF